ncbi:MAG TPA: FAD-dependent oxidoreductase [Miltoncostaeaceae bacterium]|jgi:glycine oxidase|nr:FAD-dependent oxidoreductase [Miltoncostaeaceae bacterium]
MTPRAIVLGAGAVGASCARELARAGCDVRAIDPGAGRAAASWAAAGILSPSVPQELPEPVHALAARSLELWHDIAAEHPEIELRRTGALLIGVDEAWRSWRAARGLATERVAVTAADGSAVDGLRLPEVEAVRTPRATRALLTAVAVEAREGPPLAALRRDCDLLVIATGAWASPYLDELGIAARVAPRRGQMMLFDRGDLDTVLMEKATEGVAVPRADGRVVAGTTLEDVGFDARTVPDDLARLEAWARRWIPGLGRRLDAWAGFRPWSPDPVPTVALAAPGVAVAVGHHRNGILLAPGTGELVADLLLGRPTRVPAADYAAVTIGT